jgi:hypothetical protein
MPTYRFPQLDPHQSRLRPPTDWELSLAGALEAAFGQGHHELPALLAALNASRVRPREGGAWTEANFRAVMAELGG